MTHDPANPWSSPWDNPVDQQGGGTHPASGYPGAGYPVSGYPGYSDPVSGDPGAGYPDPVSGYPQQGYPADGYAAAHSAWGAPSLPPGYPQPYQPPRKLNGLSIASMVVSMVSIMFCFAIPGLSIIPSIVGAIMGHVAKRQVQRNNETGEGFATAGIVLGWIITGLSLIIIVGFIVLIAIGSTADPMDY